VAVVLVVIFVVVPHLKKNKDEGPSFAGSWSWTSRYASPGTMCVDSSGTGTGIGGKIHFQWLGDNKVQISWPDDNQAGNNPPRTATYTPESGATKASIYLQIGVQWFRYTHESSSC
jgi:hypothetical protein